VNRTERLLDLITYLLNAKEPVSWRKIKNHFPEDYGKGIEESNQRKFERDKAELISLGIPIDYQGGSESQKEGYLIKKEKLFLPEIEFTPEESSLLMLSAGAVLENPDFPYRSQLESALFKTTSLQNHIQSPPERIAITYTRKQSETSQTAMMSKLQDALDRRKRILIRYYAFSTGETTEREVDPYGLVFRRGKWVLVGWDHLRRDLRAFVLTRIEFLEVNRKKPGTSDYEIPDDFSLREYQDQQPWDLRIHPPIDVTLEISEHRLNELLPQLKKADRIGDQTFRLKVTNQTGLMNWILSQKTDVRVIGPQEVLDAFKEALRDLV
jgi:proteasome accessory factor B